MWDSASSLADWSAVQLVSFSGGRDISPEQVTKRIPLLPSSTIRPGPLQAISLSRADPSMMSMEMEHVAFQECCLPWAAVLTHSKPTGMPDSV